MKIEDIFFHTTSNFLFVLRDFFDIDILKSRQSKIIDFPEPVSPVKTFRPLEKNISAFSINNIFVMESDFINFNQP